MLSSVSLLFCVPKTPVSSPRFFSRASHVWHLRSGIFIAALAFAHELSGFRKLVKIAILSLGRVARDIFRIPMIDRTNEAPRVLRNNSDSLWKVYN